MKKLLSAAVVLSLVAGSALVWAQDGDKAPKYSIEEVMEQAHKGGLLNKVADGEASADEKVLLLDLYLSLLENDPPKGHAESFHEKASEAVAAVARVVVGRDGAEGEIKRAVNCAACHKEHKPEE
jgi:hypothetical protein